MCKDFVIPVSPNNLVVSENDNILILNTIVNPSRYSYKYQQKLLTGELYEK